MFLTQINRIGIAGTSEFHLESNGKAGPFVTSRSLNVLKKSEKGLLILSQRSFSFWKKSSATGRCFTD